MQNFRYNCFILSEMINLQIGAYCKLCKWSFHCAGFKTRRQHFARLAKIWTWWRTNGYCIDYFKTEFKWTKSQGKDFALQILNIHMLFSNVGLNDVLLIWQNKPHGACANTCDLFNSDSVCQFAQCVHLRPRTGDITIHMLVLPLRLFRIKVYAHRTW